jgi:hypothetical protein
MRVRRVLILGPVVLLIACGAGYSTIPSVDGRYTAGTDFPTGTYVPKGVLCYWTSGGRTGHGKVTIRNKGTVISVTNCGEWEKK